MGNLNDILSLMYRMDKGYSKAVNLNEGSLAHTLLVEDKRINQARQRSRDAIRQVLSDEQLTDEQVEEKLRKFENEFYHDPRMRSSSVMRLEPLFCRLAFWYGFDDENENFNADSELKEILNFLFKKQNEIDLVSLIPNEALYTLTYDDLVDMFEEQMETESEAETQEIAKNNYTPNDYEIIGPLDYAEAHEIGNLSYYGSRLCYTQDEATWDDYTNNGSNTAYVALKNGWDDEEKFPPVHDRDFVSPYDPMHLPTDESPYDTYGLSMIFIFVSKNGELTTCNTRWNHNAYYPGNSSTDHALDRKQISQILGVNFIKRFCYNVDVKFEQAVKNAIQLLKNGDTSGFDKMQPLSKNNDNYQVVDFLGIAVEILGKWNVLVDGKLKYKMWFNDFIQPNIVRLGNKYNILDENGDFLFKVPYVKWMININYDDSIGMYRLNRNNKLNLYDGNPKGLVVSKNWFDGMCIYDLGVGFVEVRCENFYNLVNSKTKQLIFNDWVNTISYMYYQQGFIIIKDEKYNIVNKFGELVSDEWFDWINATKPEYIRAILYGEPYIVYVDDKRIEKVNRANYSDFFDSITKSSVLEGFYEVQLGNSYNLMDSNYNLFSEKWFSEMIDCDSYYIVTYKYKRNYLMKNGQFLWRKPYDEWFTSASKFQYHDYALVSIRSMYKSKNNFLNIDGDFYFDEWVDNIGLDYNHPEFYYILIRDKINYLNGNTMTLVWNAPISEWFNSMKLVYEDYWQVSLNGKNNFIHNGKLVWEQPIESWFDVMVGPLKTKYRFAENEFWGMNKEDNKFFTVVKDNKILGKISQKDAVNMIHIY